jgi:trehalose/maltose hydrolase-like predicted phosphorylase
MDVIPPDEYAFGNNSVFTNVVAKISLEFAAAIGKKLGKNVPGNWTTIANRLKIPFDEKLQLHLEYDEYNVAQHQIIKQVFVTKSSCVLHKNLIISKSALGLVCFGRLM